jgi:hypothetical protein
VKRRAPTIPVVPLGVSLSMTTKSETNDSKNRSMDLCTQQPTEKPPVARPPRLSSLATASMPVFGTMSHGTHEQVLELVREQERERNDRGTDALAPAPPEQLGRLESVNNVHEVTTPAARTPNRSERRLPPQAGRLARQQHGDAPKGPLALRHSGVASMAMFIETTPRTNGAAQSPWLCRRRSTPSG